MIYDYLPIKCLAYVTDMDAYKFPNPLMPTDSMNISIIVWTVFVNVMSARSTVRLSVYEAMWPSLMILQCVVCALMAAYLSLFATDTAESNKGCRDMNGDSY
jgi:hypothetical protein